MENIEAEGNRLILIFDGGKIRVKKDERTNIDGKMREGIEFYDHPVHGNNLGEHGLRYHSSWDWLMPAWNKIYLFMENTRDWKDNGIAYNEGADYRDNFGIAMNHNDIQTCFEICVEAIKWHNALQSHQTTLPK